MYQTEETKVAPGHESQFVSEDPSKVPADVEIRSGGSFDVPIPSVPVPNDPPELPALSSMVLRTSRFHQAVLTEWLGTTLWVFFLVLAIMSGGGVVRVALTAGLTFFVLSYMFYGTSGGHFNPSVTLALLLARRTTPLRALFYFVAQIIGAITGAALARSISIAQFKAVQGGANRLPHGISSGSGFWLEILGTMFFTMAVLSATDTKNVARYPHRRVLIPLQIGLALFVAHVTMIPYTNCSVNPARSFGTSLVANYWNHHWIFWFAPLIGGAMGATVYSILFFFNEDPKEMDLEGGNIFGNLGGGRTSSTGMRV